MTIAYHLWLQDEAKGPFTIGQLRAMWGNGQLTGDNLFSTNAGQEWQRLSEITENLEDAPGLQAKTPAAFGTEDANYKKLIQNHIQDGWSVVSESETGTQLQIQSGMGPGTAICLTLGGVIAFVNLYAGLILIFAAGVGYLARKPITKFVYRLGAPPEPPKDPLEQRVLIYGLLLVVGIIIANYRSGF